jgi:hypothetical protein
VIGPQEDGQANVVVLKFPQPSVRDLAGGPFDPGKDRQVVDRTGILRLISGRQITRIQIGAYEAIRRASETLQWQGFLFVDVDDAPALNGETNGEHQTRETVAYDRDHAAMLDLA